MKEREEMKKIERKKNEKSERRERDLGCWKITH